MFPMIIRKFTPAEIAILRERWLAGDTLDAIGRRLNRNAKVIAEKRRALGLPDRDASVVTQNRLMAQFPDMVFSAEEDDFLAFCWRAGHGREMIATLFQQQFKRPLTWRQVGRRIANIRETHKLDLRTGGVRIPSEQEIARRISAAEQRREEKIEAAKADLLRARQKEPEAVTALRAFLPIDRAYGGLWLVNGADILTLAQVEGRLEWERGRSRRAVA